MFAPTDRFTHEEAGNTGRRRVRPNRWHQAAILTNFIVHMLDLQLKHQVAVPRSHRPRVSPIIDEAHRLITATLITMIATHREAGLNVAAAVQYVSQLGADEPSAARREK